LNLEQAAALDQVQVVRDFIAAHVARGDSGPALHRALRWAARYGATESARVLLAGGAAVEPVDEQGRTVLHEACRGGSASLVTTLLAYGPDLDARDREGCTALHYAVAEDAPDLADLLLEHGADPDLVDEQGCTPLYGACSQSQAVARALLRGGAQADLLPAGGEDLFSLALEHHYLDLARDLLEPPSGAL
jgi:ankyrin repeat protein